jgi:hypothetical protein
MYPNMTRLYRCIKMAKSLQLLSFHCMEMRPFHESRGVKQDLRILMIGTSGLFPSSDVCGTFDAAKRR